MDVSEVRQRMLGMYGIRVEPEMGRYVLRQLAQAGIAVVEDAHSGVQAGRAGGFGLVVGVDRGAGALELLGSGADLVVDDLAELIPDLPASPEGPA